MTAEQPSLLGKTVALLGLAREDLIAISSVLDGEGVDWQAFGRIPDAAKLRPFDLLICEASLCESAAPAGVPMLGVGAGTPAAAQDFVLSPVRGEELLLRASRLAGQRPQVTRRTAAATPQVLTADDDPTTTAIIRAVITQNAMTCHTARDGREALEVARSIVPDAIVLDVNMPYVDGFEVLTTLRNDPVTASIPVLMLTSVQQEADVVKAFRLGAHDYVAKPFNPMELLARVKRLVART